MIEPQRPILLPPPDSAGPSGRARASAGAPVLPVARMQGARAGDAEDVGSWPGAPRLEDEEAGDATAMPLRERRTSRGTAMVAGATVRSPFIGASPARTAPFSSLAFLAQQIFQETMTTGLHLEPWAEGIGAYRRAGAAPPLEDGSAALFSVAV